MSHPDPSSVVRIAIALVALKHKPRDQSIASYLLDLQSRFPVGAKANENQDWRTYALELEKQLATLKAQRDADQELLSKLPVDASQVASTSDAPPKKKSKKNPTKDQHDPDWSWDQSRADWSRFLASQYPSAPSLTVAYISLKGALAALNADLLSYASRLTDAILRALDTTHLFLFSPPNPSPDSHTQATLGTPQQLKLAHIDSTRIALASPLLMYVLRTVLHTLVRTAQDGTKSRRPRQRQHPATPAADVYTHVDKVLDRLLERILLSLLRSLIPLCSARLAPLVSMSVKKDKDKANRAAGKGKGKDKDRRTGSTEVDPLKRTDVRADVFALIGASLEALDALPPLVRPSVPGMSADGARGGPGSIAGGIRDRLGLETIRELEALYAVPLPPSSLQPSSQQPPLSTPTPTPLSTQLPSQSQPQPRTQQRAVSESRAKRLERLAGTRAERVRALATRDAGWFLASTLNLCVTPPTLTPASGHGVAAAARTDTSGGLLREALLDRIGKLVRSMPFGDPVSDDTNQQVSNPSSTLGGGTAANHNATNFKLAIDPVCQSMLLAICERAMSNLISS